MRQYVWHVAAIHQSNFTAMPEPCVTCGGVHGSYDPLDWCRCDRCARCDELVKDDLRRWLGTTINPQGRAV